MHTCIYIPIYIRNGMYYTLLCIKHMFRTQLNFTMSGTLGIKFSCFGPVYWPSSGCN